MCRVYGVTRAGYYAWRARGVSERAARDAELLEEIRAIHTDHEGRYGGPRVHGALQRRGVRVGGKRVARLMRENGLRGKAADLYRSRAGQKALQASLESPALDALADQPDRVWLGDVTYLRIGLVWFYLAVVLDRHSRRVLSWVIRERRIAGLTIAALQRALRERRPGSGLIFHSDRGAEYTAEAYREVLTRHGIVQSVNRPSRMNDNAFMESFFHTMKAELDDKLEVKSVAELRRVVGTYIEYYNTRRAHTSLQHLSPTEFEGVRC